MNTIEQSAKSLVEAYDVWCQADGWDNPEWDQVAERIDELRRHLRLPEDTSGAMRE